MTFTLRLSNSGLQLGDAAELGRADRREVLGVREEHAPAVAEVVVEGDRALGGLRGEVRGFVAQRIAMASSVFVRLVVGRSRVAEPAAAPPGGTKSS